MTRAFERRVQRVLGTTHDLLGRSKWVIWCFEPEHMPVMIDLLIARGVLGEADRPHCVHWTSVKGPGEVTQDEVRRRVDADEMLEKAGIGTMGKELWEAWRKGRGAVEALWREWFGELGADDLKFLADLESQVQRPRARERTGDASLNHASATDKGRS